MTYEQKTVLVADDDAQMRLSLRYVLGRAGYTVEEAVNGRDAVNRINAREGGYDAVLMDILMPDQEGIETILQLRRTHPDLRIIAMSGGARLYDFDPLKLAQDCGANFVIAKPFEPAALRKLLAICLGGAD
ncbi:MAG TPA: response regulator [Alphaproteobacteria bacterium]|nr:response regulator [Alphaproteobacteria bacterium]